MRYRLLLILLLLLTTACTKKDESAVKPDSNETSTAVKTPTPEEIEAAKAEERKAAEMAEAARVKAEEEAAAKRLVDATENYEALMEEFKSANKEFSIARGKIKSREAFMEFSKNNPLTPVCDKFVDFAKEFAGTPEAFDSLTMMANQGQGDARNNAMKLLLEIVGENPEHEQAYQTLTLIAKRGAGKSKSNAMSKLLVIATADPDSDESYDTLSLLAFSRGKDKSKATAVEKLLASVESDPDSDRSIECLAKFATAGEGDTKTESLEKMISNHVDHDAMVGVISSMTRGLPSAQTEERIKQIREKTTSAKIQGNALIAQIGMVNGINTYKGFMADMEEEDLKRFGDDVVKYVNAERDENEMKDLTADLEKFVKDHAGVVDKAEKELFVLKNLSVGCEAPEITGVDLDGKEFSLSDYRGKVVFLDFWGDW